MWSPERPGAVPAQVGTVTFNDLGIAGTAGRTGIFFKQLFFARRGLAFN